MKYTASFILLILTSILLFSGCKKYPEGPLINFESKLQRVDGIWDVEYFGINGYDSTANLKNWPYYGYYEFSHLDRGGHLSFSYLPIGHLAHNTAGYWEFQDRKNNLFVVQNQYITPSNPSFGAYAAPAVSWEIRRLMTEQLWIRTVYRDGREYYIKFKHVNV